MFAKTITSISLTCLLVSACASNRAMNSDKSAVASPQVTAPFDSVRTLIRRGLTDDARKALEQNCASFSEANHLALKASSFEKEGNWSEVIVVLGKAVPLQPDSMGWQMRLWVAMTNAAGKDSANVASAHATIRTQGDYLAQSNALRDCYLSYFAASLLGDTTAEARSDRLIQLYPDSKEASDLIGSRFWDGMYPIWTNDSAKVPYFHAFIRKYSASDWAQYARRNLIASYFALGDTASAVSMARLMVYFAGDNPLVLAHGVAALMDVPGQEDSVRAWAERAYALREKLTRPSYYSVPEWALIEQATRAGFPLTLAGIYLRSTAAPADLVAPASPPVDSSHPAAEGGATDSLLALARRYAEESHRLAVYDIDDNNTSAPQHFMLGRIALAEGDSTEAAEWWVEAAIDGDVYNRFAGRAVDSLKVMVRLTTENAESKEGTERELLDHCRKVANYKGITFDRVTSEVGLDSARGSRVAWGDYDNDGGDDLLAGGTALFRARRWQFSIDTMSRGRKVPDILGGFHRFEVANQNSSLTVEGCHGGIWADYDNDGDNDLFAFSSSGNIATAEKLLTNDGAGHLASASTSALSDSFSTEAAIWFDANGDGRLDLYIPGYERPAKGADDLGNAWPSRLMVQDNDGVFHDSTEAFGLVPKDGRWLCGRSPVACDFDRDGDQDLYVGNYRLQENQFWINGKWKMENRTKDAEFRLPSSIFHNMADFYQIDGDEVEGWWGHTIGCQWADFDTDGDFDLIACNLAHPRYIGFSNRTMLYRNDVVEMENGTWKMEHGTKPEERGFKSNPYKFHVREGRDSSPAIIDEGDNPKPKAQSPMPFTNVQREWGIKYEECHSEPVFGDFDNDGDLDLFITCVYPNRRSFLYENKGDHFKDVTFLSGVRIFNGWGCATSDYDNDGRLDLAACEGGKIELFHNTTKNSNNWLEVAPDRTPGGHLSQIGGIVEVIAEGKKYIRQFEGGKGAGSQNSGTLHFGLGKAKACELRVFNYGESYSYDGMNVNQKFEIGK